MQLSFHCTCTVAIKFVTNCTRTQEHSIPDPAPVVMRRRNAVSGNVIKEEDATNYVKKVTVG